MLKRPMLYPFVLTLDYRKLLLLSIETFSFPKNEMELKKRTSRIIDDVNHVLQNCSTKLRYESQYQDKSRKLSGKRISLLSANN